MGRRGKAFSSGRGFGSYQVAASEDRENKESFVPGELYQEARKRFLCFGSAAYTPRCNSSEVPSPGYCCPLRFLQDVLTNRMLFSISNKQI